MPIGGGWEEKGFLVMGAYGDKTRECPWPINPTQWTFLYRRCSPTHPLPQQPWPARGGEHRCFPTAAPEVTAEMEGKYIINMLQRHYPGPGRSWSSNRQQKVLAGEGQRLCFPFAASCRVGHVLQVLAPKQALMRIQGLWTQGQQWWP